MAKPTVDQSTFNQINAGTSIEGKINSNGNFRMDGNLKGTIDCKGKVVIGASSVIEGDIYCTNADVMGKIIGNVYVSEHLVLKSTAFIEGNIQTKQLSVEPGAEFNGSCEMGNSTSTLSKNNTQNHQQAVEV